VTLKLISSYNKHKVGDIKVVNLGLQYEIIKVFSGNSWATGGALELGITVRDHKAVFGEFLGHRWGP
jgi:hypothetical protein